MKILVKNKLKLVEQSKINKKIVIQFLVKPNNLN